MSFWQSKAKIKPEDKIFSEFIRLRDKECVFKVKCNGGVRYKDDGSVDIRNLHTCHFFGRGKKSVRFDEDNCDAGCRSCHLYLDGDGQEWHREFKKKLLGERRFDLLEIRANQPSKIDEKIVKMYYKKQVKEMK